MTVDKQLALDFTVCRNYGKWDKSLNVEAKVTRVYPNGEPCGGYDEYPHKDIKITAHGTDGYEARGLTEWQTLFDGAYGGAPIERVLPACQALQKVEAALQKASAPESFSQYVQIVADALGIKRARVTFYGADADGGRVPNEPVYYRTIGLAASALQKLEGDWAVDAKARDQEARERQAVEA